jgi:hypothetical protein
MLLAYIKWLGVHSVARQFFAFFGVHMHVPQMFWGACLCTPAFWCALWPYTNIIGVHTCAHQNLGVHEVKAGCA